MQTIEKILEAIYAQKYISLTNSSTAMRGRSKPERVDVRLDLLQICEFTITKRKYYIWKTFEHNYLFMAVIHSKYRQGETQPSKSSRANQPPLTNLVMDGPFSQQLRIMHSLSSREDLLSPHEHVVRIGVFLVGKKKRKITFKLQNSKT